MKKLYFVFFLLLVSCASTNTKETRYNNGILEEGRFDPITKVLVDGKINMPDGQIEEGKFDRVTGILLEVKRIDNKGDTHEGTFDNISGRLKNGKITFSGGSYKEGTFNNEGYLVTGIIKIFTGSKMEGVFFTKDSNLIQRGIYTSSDGTRIVEGEFDFKTTNLIKGKVINLAEQIIMEGMFDVKNGDFKEGTLTNKNTGVIAKGTFNPKGGTLINGWIFDPKSGLEFEVKKGKPVN